LKKKVFKLFFAWQDEKEEEWLNSMASKGWFLESYHIFYYAFIKDIPQSDTIYKLDYRKEKESDEYFSLYEECGWKHVTQFHGWHYFKGDKNNVFTPELYTDKHSKSEKYMALLFTLSLSMLSLLLIGLSITTNSLPSNLSWFKYIYLFLIIIMSFAVIKITMKVKYLRK
jgi:hypothetical protein